MLLFPAVRPALVVRVLNCLPEKVRRLRSSTSMRVPRIRPPTGSGSRVVAPLYVPLVKALGFDLIWYGVLYTITCQIAYMTPPFGYNLFLMRAMAPPEISIIDIYRSVFPFVGVMVVMLAIMMVFPELAMWLPNHVYGK
jgi:TRAP-type C4-dicarboxylate transport system permease large subunit